MYQAKAFLFVLYMPKAQQKRLEPWHLCTLVSTFGNLETMLYEREDHIPRRASFFSPAQDLMSVKEKQ